MSAARAADAPGSPFWRFSLGFYRQPAVAEACIALQEDSGVDVNLLLFLLWQATRARMLTCDDIEKLEQRIAPWREMTVVPLRHVRRALKSPPDLVAREAAELLRTRIKALELETERLQQEAMYGLAASARLGSEASSPAAAAQASLAAYERMRRASFSRPAVETLLAALAGPERSKEE